MNANGATRANISNEYLVLAALWNEASEMARSIVVCLTVMVTDDISVSVNYVGETSTEMDDEKLTKVDDVVR